MNFNKESSKSASIVNAKFLQTLTAMSMLAFILAVGCQDKPGKKSSTSVASIDSVNIIAYSKGFQLLQSSCFTCHSPHADSKSLAAPSMAMIKSHYLEKYKTRELFVEAVTEQVKNPSDDKTLIPGAVEKFGIMPKLSLPEQDLQQAAQYLFYQPIESSDWFRSIYPMEKEKYAKSQSELPPLERGQKIALQTKSVLGKNLKMALNTKGPEEAVQFCNHRAYPLTDSMGIELNATVKRVSDQPRNPLNKANASEEAYILQVKEILKAGGEPKAQVKEFNGKAIGYYPIITNQMCMNCHGKPNTQIKTSTLDVINRLYPEDNAIGYGENQLRGIWGD